MPSVLQRLAARTCAITAGDLTPHGLNLVRVALTDTVAVTLAGSTEPSVGLVRSLATAPGGSLLLGTAVRRNAMDAGMVNAVAGHALDYDDGNLVIVGHPSVVLIPAVLALGEELGASQYDVAVAYAAGYEAMVRLARGVNTVHYEKGWHPTSTLGVFGAAAASARLLQLDVEQTTVALALAASMASGVKSNFGTMAKALHIGHAVRDGIGCARLAKGGFTANPSALEARQGFLDVYNGAGSYDIEAIFDGPDDLEVNRGLNPIKGYGCCHSTHSAVDAAREIVGRGVKADEVTAVTIEVDAKRMPHTDRPVLAEALAGKFSLQYVVSRALVDGSVRLEHFVGDAHRDPAVLALMDRVAVVATPGEGSNSFAATVTVATRDGRTEQASSDPVLAGVEHHAHPPQLWDKLSDCAAQVLPAGQVEALARQLRDFPAVAGISDLLDACVVGTPA